MVSQYYASHGSGGKEYDLGGGSFTDEVTRTFDNR